MSYILKECIVIGAGISGLAVAKWLKEYKIDFVVVEKSDEIGGLWRYRDDDYGVMKFTHINVSKYNYCYSDHPFPAESTDYPHHTEMYDYVKSYARRFELHKQIQFRHEVLLVEELVDKEHELNKSRPEFEHVKFYDRLWSVRVRDLETNEVKVYIAPYVSVASGHHGLPSYAQFPGQETFPQENIIHSVKFKSASINKMEGKRVLVVGIGNSAVDAAVNLLNEGRCPNVTISTRSGAWIIPNYISGYATDLYACRAFFTIPWRVGAFVMENVIKFIYGHPNTYKLNPKMSPLQSQPTVCPTLIHHIQRKEIKIQPNIKQIDGNRVQFENGEEDEFDFIIMCTGYKIGLDFLKSDLRSKVFSNKSETNLNLFKHVFQPELGRSLGFIGFIQPSSGGLLLVSEIQARWFVHLMLNRVKLPTQVEMNEQIREDHRKVQERFFGSKRHALQEDPITYNDQISAYFNAKPSIANNLGLLYRLWFGSCGPAQWRLNGPDSMRDAHKIVKSVPVTDMMKFGALLVLLLCLYCLFYVFQHPHYFGLLAVAYIFYSTFYKNRD